MALSLPVGNNKAPSQNVNLSSVSWRNVDLYTLLNHGNVLQIFKKPTYFLNGVPTKTLLTQTLAAKALRSFVNVIYLPVYRQVLLPSPLIKRFTLFSFPEAKKWPLQRTVFSQLRNQLGKLQPTNKKRKVSRNLQSIITHRGSFHLHNMHEAWLVQQVGVTSSSSDLRIAFIISNRSDFPFWSSHPRV